MDPETADAPVVRCALPGDAEALPGLWALVFGPTHDTADPPLWARNARRWFEHAVGDPRTATFPVALVGGRIVATAMGTLEWGVPNPMCPTGRGVRLSNVCTEPEFRGRGLATLMVREVIAWARSIGADRVDLSATPDGEGLYLREGFVRTSAPRMKLVLHPQ